MEECKKNGNYDILGVGMGLRFRDYEEPFFQALLARP